MNQDCVYRYLASEWAYIQFERVASSRWAAMQSILRQLLSGGSISRESWPNTPVAHGAQIIVFWNASADAAATPALRTHAALEGEIARLNGLRGPTPCVVDIPRQIA